MSRSMRQLARQRLDRDLAEYAMVSGFNRLAPRGGWIRSIREALGMSREALARRVGVRPEAVKKFESAESRGAIRLDSLRRIAAAMDCEFVYAFVPRRPLQEIVDERRMQLYRKISEETRGHMALEGQAVSSADIESAAREEAARLYPDERLWDEP